MFKPKCSDEDHEADDNDVVTWVHMTAWGEEIQFEIKCKHCRYYGSITVETRHLDWNDSDQDDE